MCLFQNVIEKGVNKEVILSDPLFKNNDMSDSQQRPLNLFLIRKKMRYSHFLAEIVIFNSGFSKRFMFGRHCMEI